MQRFALLCMVRNCLEITYASGLSKFSYPSLSSVTVARYGSFFRLVYENLSCAICTSYFATISKSFAADIDNEILKADIGSDCAVWEARYGRENTLPAEVIE